MKLAQSKHRLQTKGMMVQIRDGQLDLDSVIILLARENRYQNLALVMSEFGRLKESAVLNALFKVDQGPIVVLLKSLDVTEPAVKAVAEARGRRLNLPRSMNDRMVEIWRDTDLETADKVMTLTRLRAAG